MQSPSDCHADSKIAGQSTFERGAEPLTAIDRAGAPHDQAHLAEPARVAMKIQCEAYIEPAAGSGRKKTQAPLQPTLCGITTVSVDRDAARDVCLFVGRPAGRGAIPAPGPHVVCKIDDITDIDARQVNAGCLSVKIAAPPVLVMMWGTRALVLEDFLRLLRKLTESRKVGTSVRFRYSPEQVLESQRVDGDAMKAAVPVGASCALDRSSSGWSSAAPAL